MNDVRQTVQRPATAGPTPHDHAWRRIRREAGDPFRVVVEYRCDLCPARWTM